MRGHAFRRSTIAKPRRPEAEDILTALELARRNGPPPPSAAGARSRTGVIRYRLAIPFTCCACGGGAPCAACSPPRNAPSPCNHGERGWAKRGNWALIWRDLPPWASRYDPGSPVGEPVARSGLSRVITTIIRSFIVRTSASRPRKGGPAAAQRGLTRWPRLQRAGWRRLRRREVAECGRGAWKGTGWTQGGSISPPLVIRRQR